MTTLRVGAVQDNFVSSPLGGDSVAVEWMLDYKKTILSVSVSLIVLLACLVFAYARSCFLCRERIRVSRGFSGSVKALGEIAERSEKSTEVATLGPIRNFYNDVKGKQYTQDQKKLINTYAALLIEFHQLAQEKDISGSDAVYDKIKELHKQLKKSQITNKEFYLR